MFVRQKDMRAEPIRRIVVLGESTTWGYSVSSKEKCWADQLTAMLAEFQGMEIELINQGIGSNVLTCECPSYDKSAKPSALERLDGDVIALEPDLLLLSYGLNDSRGGTPADVFRRAYQELIDRVRARIDPLIVILNVYYMHEELYSLPDWDASNYDVTEVFNLIIRQLAESNDLILADVWSAEVGVDWIIDPDHCHPNDLGHRIVANRVFEAIVRNCSFVARAMPRESLITRFNETYGNGPQRPSAGGATTDAIIQEKEKKK